MVPPSTSRPDDGSGSLDAAIVTGAAAGLGRAIARRLASDGFALALLDIDAGGLDETVRLIEIDGGAADPFVIDLRDEVAIDETIRRVDHEVGPVRALVNDAAVFPSGPFLDSSPDEYDRVIAVNQRAYFFAAQSAARLMRGHGGGAIVNLGSITQHGGWSEMASYVVTKGAAAALTRALATELGRYGIRVNCVAPGAFPTQAERAQHADHDAYERRIIDSQALKRRGTEAELAAAVSFLVGPDASFVTGQTLNVDGGWIMA